MRLRSGLITTIVMITLLTSPGQTFARDFEHNLPTPRISKGGILDEHQLHTTDSRLLAQALIAQWSENDRLHSPEQAPYDVLREQGPGFFSGIYDDEAGQYRRELAKAKRSKEKGPYTFRENTELRLFFPIEAFQQILKKGFLNQHQAGLKLTRGAKKPEWRAELENRRLGIRIEAKYGKRRDNPAHFLRPKSAILDVSRVPEFKNSGLGSRGTMYGEIGAIFKDRVKDRAIWSAGDSYEPRHTTTWHAPDSHSFDYAFYRRTFEGVRDYFEAQILGELDLRDVKAFMVPEAIEESALELVKTAGLPIYSYRKERLPQGYGEQLVLSQEPLFTGNKRLMKELDRPVRSTWAGFRARFGTNLSSCAKLLESP